MTGDRPAWLAASADGTAERFLVGAAIGTGMIALDTTAEAIAEGEVLQRRYLGVGTHAH